MCIALICILILLLFKLIETSSDSPVRQVMLQVGIQCEDH